MATPLDKIGISFQPFGCKLNGVPPNRTTPMANYVGIARSTFFRVKDEAAFRAAIDEIPGLGIYEQSDAAGNQVFAIHAGDNDGGGWPEWMIDEDTEEDIEIDLPQTLGQHLADDSVAILMETGNEKMRYLYGAAVAVDSLGNVERLSLDDIFERAAQTLKGEAGDWS